jgi:phage shock protein A
MITPAKVEARLVELSKEIDECHKDLVNAESDYHNAKATYEIAIAKSRMKNSHTDMKMTATMREDQALIENEDLHMRIAAIEATVKAVRANAARLKTQVDITRSVSSSLKASMDI